MRVLRLFLALHPRLASVFASIRGCYSCPFAVAIRVNSRLSLQRVVSPIPINPQSPDQARTLLQVIRGQMIAAYQIQHS
jgi:hypothetical protein